MDQHIPYSLLQLAPNKSLFKKGQYYTFFYQLIEGTVKITINQIPIEITSPLIFGDYEIMQDIDYRITNIKTVTKCIIKAIPLQYYSKINHYFDELQSAFAKNTIQNKVLNYWLKKLFEVKLVNKNDIIGSDQAIGVILDGQFRIDRNIPIMKMKTKKMQLLRKFQICLLAPYEMFQSEIVCETVKGRVGFCSYNYVEQLSLHFQQFQCILKLTKLKDQFHNNLTKNIAKSCKKKAKLFQQMVPLPLKQYVCSVKEKEQSRGSSQMLNQQIHKQKKNLDLLNSSPPLKLLNLSPRVAKITEDVYSVKDNISQFLHRQWKDSLSMKIKRKIKYSLQVSKLRSPRSSPKKDINQFTRAELVSLTIPKQFKEQKFKMKMLMKAPQPFFQLRSRRFKTQGNQSSQRRPLLFT